MSQMDLAGMRMDLRMLEKAVNELTRRVDALERAASTSPSPLPPATFVDHEYDALLREAQNKIAPPTYARWQVGDVTWLTAAELTESRPFMPTADDFRALMAQVEFETDADASAFASSVARTRAMKDDDGA